MNFFDISSSSVCLFFIFLPHLINDILQEKHIEFMLLERVCQILVINIITIKRCGPNLLQQLLRENMSRFTSPAARDFARQVARILWIWCVFILVTYGTWEKKCNLVYRIVPGIEGGVNGMLLCVKSLSPFFALLLLVLPLLPFLSVSFMSPRLNVRRIKYSRLNVSLSLWCIRSIFSIIIRDLFVFASYLYAVFALFCQYGSHFSFFSFMNTVIFFNNKQQ